MLDQRFPPKILKIVDVSYGGDNGFNQAIELSQEVLSNVKFIQEKKLISKFFEEIAQETSKYCYGIKDTLYALEGGAIETLIVWENFEHMRYILRNESTQEEKVVFMSKEESKDASKFIENGVKLEVVDSQPLLEWLADTYKKYGATLEIVTNKSQEGSQFCKGFGGIGGLLRYKVDLSAGDEPEATAEDDLDAFF
jgi:peptide chain release factor subunit 1